MKTSILLRRTLWATVVFAELSALAAFFLTDRWAAVHDITNGQGTVFCIGLLAFSGLAAYAALRREVSRMLIWSLLAMHLLYVLFLTTRLFSAPALSSAGTEIILISMVDTIILAGFLITGLHRSEHPVKTAGLAR